MVCTEFYRHFFLFVFKTEPFLKFNIHYKGSEKPNISVTRSKFSPYQIISQLLLYCQSQRVIFFIPLNLKKKKIVKETFLLFVYL